MWLCPYPQPLNGSVLGAPVSSVSHKGGFVTCVKRVPTPAVRVCVCVFI